MNKKTKKQLVYEYILEHGPMVSSQAADALGFPRLNTGSMASQMAATGLLKRVSSSDNPKAPRVYEAVKGAWVAYGPPKTIRQRVYDHIKKKGPMTSAEAAEGLDIKRKSASVVAGQMASDGLLCIVGEKGRGMSRGRIYEAVEGARPRGKGRASRGRVFVEPVVVIKLQEGESQRDAKIRTHDDHKASLESVVSSLGGGPFGLMAAQLGAGA